MRSVKMNENGMWRSGPMPGSLRNDEQWRCCFCCHVRTGTISLGVIHLTFHLLSILAIIVAVLQPQIPLTFSADNQSAAALGKAQGVPVVDIVTINTEDPVPTVRTIITENFNASLVIILGSTVIAALLIHGAAKGRPSYLLPFFCLEVFSLFATSLSVLGYFALVPDIRTIVTNSPDFPMRDELLKMDSVYLAFSLLAAALISLSIKAYCISIVWKCYKYLIYLNMADSHAGEIETRADHDLPNYAAVVEEDHKFDHTAPPPPYSAVVLLPQDKI